MIEGPHRFIKEFSDAGSDFITIHAEAYPSRETSKKKSGLKKGISKATDKIDVDKVKRCCQK
jgi:pentose-5-phosphate-3-epimerase